MVSCDDINYFFTTYRENLKKSFQWNERISFSESKEEWLTNMKYRASAMSDIFIENQSMIDDFLKPILANSASLSDEGFDLMLTWLIKMYYGDYDEPFFLRALSLSLIPHYEKLHSVENLLFLYICAGYAYLEISHAAEPEAGYEAVSYYKKVIGYRDEIEHFTKPLSRDYIFIAYSNLICAAPVSGFLTLDEAYNLFQELMELRKLDKFCQYDETNPRIPQIIDIIKNSFYNCPVVLNLNLNPDNSSVKELLTEYVKEYFPKCLAEKGSIYQCNADLVFHYFSGGGKKYYDKNWMILDDYYLHLLKYVYKNLEPDNAMIYFTYPLCLIELLNHTSLPADLKQAKCKFYREVAASHLKTAASGFHSYDLNYAIQSFAFHPILLQSFPNSEERETYIFKFILARHVNTFTHSMMVAKITDSILSFAFSCQPELLIGALPNICTVDDVLLNKQKIFDYMHHAALFHDIGKNAMTDIINTQHRKISDYAFSIIKKHPEKGAMYLSRHEDFAKYQDVALGHHITYDGKDGYPSGFDKNSSPYRTTIDFVRISDCLDAATDSLSRYYHESKPFSTVMKEFKAGCGTLYHPGIVQLIFDYPDLYKTLELMTGEHRKDIYYEIYQTFIHREL